MPEAPFRIAPLRPWWAALLLGAALAAGLAACSPSSPDKTLFAQLPPDSTGITFVNKVEDQPERHLLTYEYFYNGGGVAAGDVNGDGRPDLYFTANMGPNALYLNRGDMQFQEVTRAAGVRQANGWATGITMADVNGDGALDLYVCRAGPPGTENRRNKLYINQGTGADGVPHFEERAAAYGLDDPAYSTHATFFDYDRDGDLDLYLLNHPPVRDARMGAQGSWKTRVAGDKLYRNDLGTSESGGVPFVDVTEKAGLRTPTLGYGLSATVSDVNQDGWMDLYVANDYAVEDRLYINQQDGTFRDAIHDWVGHMPASSMGADIADYNNDRRPDIFVADMLAADNRRQKLLRITQTPGYRKTVQYMRNMLQLHNGNGTFSEIGQLAGVSNTDWSWAALFADYDLDGFKDLYVTNGFRRDYTNKDFLFSTYLPALRNQQRSDGDSVDLYALAQQIPSTPLANYAFRNAHDLTFETKTEAWGLGQKGFSNGAAYADLDTDGDLDLIVNNINEPAWVYRNNAREQTEHGYLRVTLDGAKRNPFGVGASVTLTTPDGQTFFQEMIPARGFQSSVEPALTFGLGDATQVELVVTWPDARRQRIADVQANQTITLRQEEATTQTPPEEPAPALRFTETAPQARGLAFSHRENQFRDYRHEPLLPHMLSRLGPALARGDANGDGRADVFVGGARGQAATLFLQQKDGTFAAAAVDAFAPDAAFEDVDATFADVDGDGDADLYVVSGGTSEVRADAYQDRLYLNNGTGSFERAADALPPIRSSGGTVAAHDYDRDGDVDLFVGGRVRPNAYPQAPRSYLLENTGEGFQDATPDALQRPGMVADARWRDLTGDGAEELVVAGEWMPVRVYQPQDDGTFTERTKTLRLDGTGGWWNRLALADLDGDGDLDIVAGNRGRNAQVQARPDEPASIYAGDFDQDGSVEPIMSHFVDGTEYPVPRRDLLVDELNLFVSRFPTYASYAEATMDEVLTDAQRDRASRLQAHTFATSVFVQQDDGTFVRQDLPVEAQFSPTRGIVVRDVNGDDRPDLLLAGNDLTVRPPWGPSDAGQGVLLLNRGNLAFDAQRAAHSGFYAPGDVRDLLLVPTADAPLVLVGTNDASLDLFELQRPPEEVATR